MSALASIIATGGSLAEFFQNARWNPDKTATKHLARQVVLAEPTNRIAVRYLAKRCLDSSEKALAGRLLVWSSTLGPVDLVEQDALVAAISTFGPRSYAETAMRRAFELTDRVGLREASAKYLTLAVVSRARRIVEGLVGRPIGETLDFLDSDSGGETVVKSDASFLARAREALGETPYAAFRATGRDRPCPYCGEESRLDRVLEYSISDGVDLYIDMPALSRVVLGAPSSSAIAIAILRELFKELGERDPDHLSVDLIRCGHCDLHYPNHPFDPPLVERAVNSIHRDYTIAGQPLFTRTTSYSFMRRKVAPVLLLRRLAGGDLSGMRILDVGAAEGGMCVALDILGARAWGIEPHPRAAAFAGLAVGPERIETGFYGPARYPADAFDAILCFHTLEHCVDPRRMVDGFLRHLTPGGRLLLQVPRVAPYPDGRLRWTGGTNILGLTPRFLERLFREAGFTDIDVFHPMDAESEAPEDMDQELKAPLS